LTFTRAETNLRQSIFAASSSIRRDATRGRSRSVAPSFRTLARFGLERASGSPRPKRRSRGSSRLLRAPCIYQCASSAASSRVALRFS
jgi:hypothetical protein